MSFSLAMPRQVPKATLDEAVAFESVYRQQFAGVWRVLRRMGVRPAQLDDATQDVFLVVHRRLREYEERGSPRSWLYAIALRVASDYRRRSTRRHTEPLHDVVDPAPSPARQSERRESVRLLHELLSQLDEEKRTVFVLVELEQLSAPEIAEVLDVNLNTVYSRLRAARKLFESALKRHRAQHDEGHGP